MLPLAFLISGEGGISLYHRGSVWWVVAILWAMMVIAIIISQKSGDSFIYFQF